jgi:hypothetical protein
MASKREQLSETPGWGCFAVLAIAAVPLFALTRWVWQERGLDADALGGLLMAALGASLGGLGLYRLAHWLFSRRPKETHPEWKQHLCLERSRPTVQGVILLWAVAAFWNVPIGVTIAGAVRLWGQGKPHVALLIFVGVFTLAGGCLVALAVYAALEEFTRLRGVQEPRVELSEHPLRAGESYAVTVSQPGPVDLLLWKVLLVCDVMVPYPDGEGGTNEKLETVYQDQLFGEERLHIDGGVSFSTRCSFSLPTDIRLASATETDKVRWKVAVRGHRAGWPIGFNFEFPVSVVEADGEGMP